MRIDAATQQSASPAVTAHSRRNVGGRDPKWHQLSAQGRQPAVLPPADEAKCDKFMRQPVDQWGPEEVKMRPSEQELDEVKAQCNQFDFSLAFPKCNEAYRTKKWIQFARGQVTVCKGVADKSRRPKQGCVLARHRADVSSLHELFCIAESLLTTM